MIQVHLVVQQVIQCRQEAGSKVCRDIGNARLARDKRYLLYETRGAAMSDSGIQRVNRPPDQA